MKKRWITFDLDGTLMQNPFGSWVFPEIEKMVKEQTNFQGEILEELISEHHRLMLGNRIVEAYDWDGILRDILLKNGLKVSINIGELVIKHSVQPKIHLLEDGILNMLQQLKDAGYHLAVITNGYEIYQLPVMDALQLTPLFDVIITPEKAGYGKPNIKMASTLMNNENQIIAHVGDRIDHDVIFANVLGVKSILLYKDMAQSLKVIHPMKRCETKQCVNHCENKWRKETNEYVDGFMRGNLPDMVIQSIHELVDCLQ